jgi:FAD/FMN-containing dehydrogenase
MQRREFLKSASTFTVMTQAPWSISLGFENPEPSGGVLLNDAHSGLNPTRVHSVHAPETIEALQKIVIDAAMQKRVVSISGGKHALGSQQLATDAMHIDTTSLNRVVGLDSNNGIVKVEAGIRWPELMEGLRVLQSDVENPWVIRQKQGGSDEICIGGTLSANAHGRGLGMKPIVDDVEFFELVDASGELVFCSRAKNPELFKLAIGGYGLFGVIYSVGLRLMRREKLKRVVQVVDVSEVVAILENAQANGCKYGDFQYDIDENSPTFMKRGICTLYEQVDDSVHVPLEKEKLSKEKWLNFLYLACTDRRKGFDLYTEMFRSMDEKLCLSDTSQMSTYHKGYREFINSNLKFDGPVSLMLSELYVPRKILAEFMAKAAVVLKANGIPNIYGTIRLIEQDDDTFLPWAKQKYACVIVNLLVTNSDSGIEKAVETFRALIDVSIGFEGSYYLTYHKWARKDQVLACYPQMPAFLKKKLEYDPDALFQSDWYRHNRELIPS